MEIVKYGHPALRWKAKELTELTPDFKATVRRMFDLMYEARGIGLAATQVGLPYRFFVVNTTADPKETDEELVFINPEIIRKKGNTEGEEGCLSLPELYGEVARAEEIVLEAYDINGEGFEMECSEILARVIQHENDHLDGVMFIDRMKPDEVKELQANIDDLETQFRQAQAAGTVASDQVLREQLSAMEKTFEFPVKAAPGDDHDFDNGEADDEESEDDFDEDE
ncbi:MAG: peptide deformylase [Rhodopirellula sp.]|jgi:peptide deformylase|nr:peptide deformylase [Rhodopirellula sp.]